MKDHYSIGGDDDDDDDEPNLIIDLGGDEDKREALKCDHFDGGYTQKAGPFFTLQLSCVEKRRLF